MYPGESCFDLFKGTIKLFIIDLFFQGRYRKNSLFIVAAIIISLLIGSCSNQAADERFSSPAKTYSLWLDSSSKGDIPTNMECMTKASQKFMDLQSKKRDIFISRMVQSANIFKNYSVVDERIKGDKAIVLIKDPKSGHSVAVPFQLEGGELKVYLIAMFSGIVAAGQ